MSTDSTPMLRRNGLEWSCEPCRKSKHRCDHAKPACHRCLSRGIAESCTYVAAPMKGSGSTRKRRKITATHNEGKRPSQLPRSLETTGPSAQQEDVGFLGSTAFNAVFNDNEAHLPARDSTEADVRNGIRLHNELLGSINNISGSEIIFDLLQKTVHLDRLIHCSSKSTVYTMIDPWLKRVPNMLQLDLEEFNLSTDADRKSFATLMDSNTRQTLPSTSTVPFQDFITLHKMRWELLGVYFTVCGLSLYIQDCHVSELAFIAHDEHEKLRLLLQLLEASDYCVSSCIRANGACTDLAFWLLLDNCIYASQVLGDAHYSVWRKLGDISTALFAQGIHQKLDAESTFWLKQARTRGLAYAYGIEKTLSTFVGRPTRISKRYCNITIPLDLEYEELALEGDAFIAAHTHLDSDGWYVGPATKDREFTFLRMFVMDALLREEILELCLGPRQENIKEKAQALIDSNRALYDSFPERVKYNPHFTMRPPFRNVRRYLDHIYNEFILRRFLVRHVQEDPTELVQLAHEILEAVIVQRNIRGAFQTGVGVAWAMALYGLPAAGVLAFELLQLNARAVSHARIKQTLCVFISYLKWAHLPGEGNYPLAIRGWQTLQHLMDKILTPKPAELEKPLDGTPPDSSQMNPIDLLDDFGVLDFSWLDQDHFNQALWDGLNAIV